MRRWISRLSLIIAFLSCVTIVILYHLYDTSRELSEHIYEPLSIMQQDGKLLNERQQVKLLNHLEQSNEQEFTRGQPFTVLIIGVDQRSGDKGRSDVLIVATVNPNVPSTLIMNIPRDTRTLIVGMNREDKVNHSYAYGGTAMTIATVEQLIGIPVDYYIKVDMEGFQQIIDTLGGVEVNNTFEFRYEGHDFPIGDLELQGDEALAYVRMRYDDPQGDLGRNERQKEVVKATVNHLLRIQNVFKLNKLINSVEDHVKTNLTFDHWKTMSGEQRDAFNHVETEKLDGHGQIMDGIYYYIVQEEERLRISERLRTHLIE